MTALELFAGITVYLIGVIPTGTLVARARGVEIEKVGSGNVGATNVARTLGKGAGIITLLGDVTKGVLGVLVGSLWLSKPWGNAVAAVLVVAGHCFSIPGVFKGGKGVATSLGAIVGLSPLAALFAVVAFAVVFFFSRIVSLSSISAAFAVPLVALATGKEDELCIGLVVLCLLVFWRHRENIDRIVQGTEKRFSFGETADKPPA
jgi:glycerol-3-phosphate acyltransferase PlsY